MKDACIDTGWIGPGTAALPAAECGARTGWLARAATLGLPVPPTVVLGPAAIANAAGDADRVRALLAPLEAATGRHLGDARAPLLVAVRCGLAGTGTLLPALLDIGVTPATLPTLADTLGARAAADLGRRLVQGYGTHVLGIESEEFEFALHDALKAAGATSEAELPAERLRALEAAMRALIAAEDMTIPDDPAEQIAEALAAMCRAWEGPRARTLCLARGFAADAPLTILVQRMALGVGPGVSGAGVAQSRDEATGAARLGGRWLADAQGEEALMGLRTPAVLTAAEREAGGQSVPSLEESAPEVFAAVADLLRRAEHGLGEAFRIDFTVEDGTVWLLDLVPCRRSARAALRISVDLAEEGAIGRRAALMRVGPALLDDHLHPTILPGTRSDPLAKGLPASPGAASGPLVFTTDAAEAAATAGHPAILALIETGPEDIRGMHAAAGVLTIRGGMTSHAALVARGLGRPCVVGAKELVLDRAAGVLRAPGGRVFAEGDAVTVDGTEGRVLAGHVETRPPEITGAFARLMVWADAERRLEVRANADTAQDARLAAGFNAAGIGLCRTEHMFFKRGRIAAMREMILAETAEERRAALSRLQPMQRGDFVDLFREMAGRPVVIRLLDPPLHEFLPHGAEEMEEMATHLGVPVERIRQRALELAEFNPMLGKRGCRIGIAFPEIYEMQAQAIFEAACASGRETGEPVRPEIMIPLVSAVRELEVLRALIDTVAARVLAETGEMVDYTVGVMIETPRACLRAGDIAEIADFLSFGTNDLTQMLYGLSRDDAGRFMPEYVERGVFAHDPFHRIDEEGVGEIIRIAIERARRVKPRISIGLCGEHGGDPASIDFCERAGFDYVSCSPYRVPIARLAAAQARLSHLPPGSP